MHNYAEAYTIDNLMELLEANSGAPDAFGRDNAERIVTLAQQRADARGEQSQLDSDHVECLIGTDWAGFAGDEFGYHAGKLNKWALGVLDVGRSMGRDATLFKDAVVVQQGWLETGDARYTQIEEYESDFEGASRGELWIPRKAQDYIAIIALSPELIHGDASAADAM